MFNSIFAVSLGLLIHSFHLHMMSFVVLLLYCINLDDFELRWCLKVCLVRRFAVTFSQFVYLHQFP